MYKVVDQEQFIADAQSRLIERKFAIAMFDYMVKHYNVENYNFDVILSKFEIYTVEEIKTKYKEEVKDFAQDIGIDYDSANNETLIELFENAKGYKLVKIFLTPDLDDKQVTALFDIKYYHDANEAY